MADWTTYFRSLSNVASANVANAIDHAWPTLGNAADYTVVETDVDTTVTMATAPPAGSFVTLGITIDNSHPAGTLVTEGTTISSRRDG